MTDVAAISHETTLDAEPLVSRLAIFFLVTPHEGRDGEPVDQTSRYQNLVKALEKDPRVKSLTAKPSSDVDLKAGTFAMPMPRRASTDMTAVPALPHGHFHVLRLSPSISMHIQVPRRLQSQVRGSDEIPSEDYWAAWNGVSLVISWREGDSKRPYGYSGGLIVLDVLRDAGKAAGLLTRSQPCGPNCNYPFAHTDMRLDPTPGQVGLQFVETDSRVEVACPPADPEETTRLLSAELGFSARMFAAFRGHGNTIVTTERQAREYLADLLTNQYKSVAAGIVKWHSKPRAMWQNRGLRKESSRLIASLWLCLATLEENLREWTNVRFVFDESAARNSADLVFRREYPQEVNVVTSLDVRSLRAAVEQTANRIDTRVMAVATAAGAVVGGIIGGLLGLLAS